MLVQMSVRVHKGAFYRFTLLSTYTFIDYYNKKLCLRYDLLVNNN